MYCLEVIYMYLHVSHMKIHVHNASKGPLDTGIYMYMYNVSTVKVVNYVCQKFMLNC